MKAGPRKRPTLLVFVMAIGLLAAACGASGSSASGPQSERSRVVTDLLANLRETGTVRIANTQANPPFSFVNADGDLVGYDVDVANEIATRLGIDNVKFVQGTYETFVSGLNAGKWDIVISGLTPTDERDKVVDFTCPYQVNALSLFVADSNDTIRGEAGLKGSTIAVTSGSTQEQRARKIPDASVRTYSNSTLALRDVAIGRADVYIGSRWTGSYLAERNDLDVHPVKGAISAETNAIAVPEKASALRDAINRAMKDMISDGTLSKLSKKWFGGLDMVAEFPDEFGGC